MLRSQYCLLAHAGAPWQRCRFDHSRTVLVVWKAPRHPTHGRLVSANATRGPCRQTDCRAPYRTTLDSAAQSERHACRVPAPPGSAFRSVGTAAASAPSRVPDHQVLSCRRGPSAAFHSVRCCRGPGPPHVDPAHPLPMVGAARADHPAPSPDEPGLGVTTRLCCTSRTGRPTRPAACPCPPVPVPELVSTGTGSPGTSSTVLGYCTGCAESTEAAF